MGHIPSHCTPSASASSSNPPPSAPSSATPPAPSASAAPRVAVAAPPPPTAAYARAGRSFYRPAACRTRPSTSLRGHRQRDHLLTLLLLGRRRSFFVLCTPATRALANAEAWHAGARSGAAHLASHSRAIGRSCTAARSLAAARSAPASLAHVSTDLCGTWLHGRSGVV